MKKRWIAVLLCAALLAAFGWGQPRISGEGETYDLYFLEADLSDAPGGDALRAEPLYIIRRVLPPDLRVHAVIPQGVIGRACDAAMDALGGQLPQGAQRVAVDDGV